MCEPKSACLRYQRRLAKVAVWPALAFAVLFLLLGGPLLWVIHALYIPAMLQQASITLSDAERTWMIESTQQIVLWLGAYMIAMLIVNLGLVYLVWTGRRLALSLQRKDG
ncbi:hypothetical protein HUS23_02155 [Ectothiorhodospiraceae bacterium 2226]|nr:hypothetical protein HUS23_02155 [Ectothiorhodospiraceae bacterium 2226]